MAHAELCETGCGVTSNEDQQERKQVEKQLGKVMGWVLILAILSGCGPGDSGDGTAAVEKPAEVFRFRMVTTWPKNFPGMGVAAENLAKAVDEMSDGRLTITVYGSGEVVPALGVFEAVSLGNVEMGHGAAYYWKGKVPAAQFFTTVPFGMTAQEMNAWLHHGGGMALWEELYAPYNLVPIAGGNTGVQMAGWFNKEINSIEDIQGLKMRIPGLGGEVFNRVGGSAQTLPGSEIYTSLQTGAVDATEWVGPYNDLAFGLHQVAEYYYYPGWHEPGPTLETIINKEAWDSLPGDLQAILRTASRMINEDSLSEYTARNNDALRELVEQHGVKIRRLPDDVIEALRDASREVVSALPGDDELAQRIYQSYSEFHEDVMRYHELSERAYINLRPTE